jgi:hypothetical protein
MPHDLVRKADTLAWIARAKTDIRGADIDLAAVPPLAGATRWEGQEG